MYPSVLVKYINVCTSAFWRNFCDQVLHCDMLQALFFDHLWTQAFRLQHISSKNTRPRNSVYLCSVLLADPSIHTPPTLPWAILSTCDRTIKIHGYVTCNLLNIYYCRKADLPLPFPHFYQLLVNGRSDLRLFTHDVSKIKHMRNLVGLLLTINYNMKKNISLHLYFGLVQLVNTRSF